jgi:hypothetical protein
MLSPSQKEIIISVARSQGYIKWVGGKFYTKHANTTVGTKFLAAINFPTALWDRVSELGDVLKNYEKCISEILDTLQEAGKEILAPLPTLETYVAGGSDNIASLVPMLNIERKKGDPLILLYNPENHKVLPRVDIQMYLIKSGRKEQEIINDSSVLSVVTVFDPFCPEPIVHRLHDGLNRKIAHLNLYTAPRWQRTDHAPKYEGFIKTLIEHLFPVSEERESVLDWMHYALTRRNGTILCLAGPRGTGKSLLMSILSYLIGPEYSEIGNKELLAKNFNSAFKNKRLVVFEEVEVSDSTALNRLKALANNRIALEEKGKDSETINNYTSMAILLNDISQLKISPQDRRFSAPEVAEHDLRRSIPEIDIQDFTDKLEGEEVFDEVASFGQYLMERTPKKSNMYAIKGDYYYFLCSLALAEWKNFIIQFIIDKGQVDVSLPTKRIAAAFQVHHPQAENGKGLRFPDRSSTFDEFLKDYKHRGEFYIGSLIKTYEGSREVLGIMPNPEFLNYMKEQRLKNEAKAGIEVKAPRLTLGQRVAEEDRLKAEAAAMEAL